MGDLRKSPERRALDLGFHRARTISIGDLPDALARVLGRERGVRAFNSLTGLLEPPLDPQGSILACALSTHQHQTHTAAVPWFGRFARANFYRHAVILLKPLAQDLARQFGLPWRNFRIMVNSRAPEKPVAAAAGLGTYGKHSLLLAPGLGSHFIVALLHIPAPAQEPDTTASWAEEPACRDCDACVKACPVSALPGDRTLDRTRCLQALSTGMEPWDASTMCAWGTHIYGCDTCQDVCPENAKLPLYPEIKTGLLPQNLDLARMLSLDGEGLKNVLKGTALDRAWIKPEALLRNALVAAGNSNMQEFVSLVLPHLEHPLPAVRLAAEYARNRLTAS